MDRLAAVLAVLVLLGAVTPAAGAAAAVRAAGDGANASDPAHADPPSDRIGWEDGYWHDEPIDVDQSDGLSDRELDAYVARAMARVEYIRDAEFEESVPVSVVSREEFRANGGSDDADEAFAAWNNQVWEALFIAGEESNVQEQLSATYGSSVVGFYAPEDDEIKIVTDSPDAPTIDNGTLIHELTHALQDQRGDLGEARRHGGTQDADLAVDGVVEGEANYIEALYERRCGEEWNCVSSPRGGTDGSGDRNLGILLVILQPYSDGPAYVRALRERGGWAAVDGAFDDPPDSSEQVIHRTDDPPRPIAFEDRARNGWRPYSDLGETGSDTVGEASIYAMFWYQARTADADTVDPSSLYRTSSPFETYNYDAPPSAGWGNDRVFPYRRGTGDDAAGGYVWVTEWDTERDAREFRRAHAAVLRAHDASRDGNVWTIEDGRFADTFRVTRDGTRVTVVNGPTPRAVRNIRPPAGAGEEGASGGDDAAGDGDGPVPVPGDSDGRAPGFGVVATLVALAVAAAVAGRRGRG